MVKPVGETQLLSQDELAIYEAVTVLRRSSTAEVAHASGFDGDTTRRGLERLAELRFVTLDGDTVELGLHDWDA